MYQTPIGLRKKIVVVGLTNVGKSSLINAILGDSISITSNEKGTTTDSVSRSYEILGFGPVQFYDTAGFGDKSILGKKREQAAIKTLKNADLALLIVASATFNEEEKHLQNMLKSFSIPFLIVYNKNDLIQYDKSVISVNTLTNKGVDNLLTQITLKLRDLPQPHLLDGIVKKHDKVLLVMPQDGSAPKGRLIMPQVQMIRELIDAHAFVSCIALEELEQALCIQTFDLIITDSKIIKEVLSKLDSTQKVTTFSVLFSRMKGDFKVLLEGLKALDNLQEGDKILIAESCLHTTKDDDIAKTMIPILLKKYSGKNLIFEFAHGKDLPNDLTRYKIILQCAGCVLTQKEVQNRIQTALKQGVSITNFGLVLTKCQVGHIKRLTY